MKAEIREKKTLKIKFDFLIKLEKKCYAIYPNIAQYFKFRSILNTNDYANRYI